MGHIVGYPTLDLKYGKLIFYTTIIKTTSQNMLAPSLIMGHIMMRSLMVKLPRRLLVTFTPTFAGFSMWLKLHMLSMWEKIGTNG